MERSDEMLMASYRNGDESALAVLIKRYFDSLYRYAYRLVHTAAAAEDVVQETCIKIWKYASSFKEDAMVKPWLFRIAHNTAIDYLRKKKQLNFSDLGGHEDHNEVFTDEAINVMEQSIVREAQEQLTSAVESLPLHYREVMVLRSEGFSFEEISSTAGKPAATIRSLYRRGLALLRQKLARE